MTRTRIVATVAVGAGLVAPTFVAAQTPTYNQDVAPILLDNCASCHRPNQIAPMSLLSYDDTRPWARAIKSKVQSREMPPWFADRRFGTFSNDSSLDDEQIETIVAWADGGAPEGGGQPPEPPPFSAAGWAHPDGLDPDVVIEFPVEWEVAADGEFPNFNLYQPLPFDDVMRVSATQVRPGNYAATHHITTALMSPPPGMTVGTGPAWVGGPEMDFAMIPDPDADLEALAKQRAEAAGSQEQEQVRSGVDGQERARARRGFGPYIPGVGADVAKPGQAREIRGDLFDYIVWNMHFQATGRPETSRPSIGAWLATDEVTTYQRSLSLSEHTSESQQLVAPAMTREERQAAAQARQIAQGVNLLLAPIPPGEANWTVTGIGAFQNDSFLQSILVHAHLRGKDFSFVLTYPDGREEVVLRVPNYDFDWQYEYEFAEPISVPAGSTLKSIARYDNSRANRNNPAPHKETYWSEQSWDDMFLTTASYVLAEDGAND